MEKRREASRRCASDYYSAHGNFMAFGGAFVFLPRLRASTSVFLRFGLRRCRIWLVVETMLDLLQDFSLILWFGIEVARVIPLEMGLEFASDLPIGIPEVVVDHRVRRFEVDCPFELIHGFVIAAEFVIRPAEAINNISISRAQFDRPLE